MMNDAMRSIRLIAMDVDGVLTDGGITYSDAGQELKTFNIQDGLGIVVARNAGMKFAIVTGRVSPALQRRAEELGVHYISQGCLNKSVSIRKLLDETGFRPEEVAYIGDDINDIPAFRECGLKVAVRNASNDLKMRADHITQLKGGHGAVREVIELIMESQGRWSDAVEKFLQHLEQSECPI